MEPHTGSFFSRLSGGKADNTKPEGCSNPPQLAVLPQGKCSSWGEERVLQGRGSDLLLWEIEGKPAQDTVTGMLWLMKPIIYKENRHLDRVRYFFSSLG